MLAASLAAIPPYRANGDDAAVQRLIKRPNSALEAMARAPVELVYGFSGAAFGLLLDPVAVRRGVWVGTCVIGRRLPRAEGVAVAASQRCRRCSCDTSSDAPCLPLPPLPHLTCCRAGRRRAGGA